METDRANINYFKRYSQFFIHLFNFSHAFDSHDFDVIYKCTNYKTFDICCSDKDDVVGIDTM